MRRITAAIHMRITAAIGTRITAAIFMAMAVAGTRSAVAQSQSGFPAELFAERRAALMETLGDGALVAFGNQLMSPSGPEKQSPNFWYLTGVESPFAILVVVKDGDAIREVMFVPEHYQFAASNYPIPDPRFREAAWNRPVLRVTPDEAGRRMSGIDELYPVEEFSERLPEIVAGYDAVFLSGESPTAYTPPGLARMESISGQLEESVRTLLPGHSFASATRALRRMRLNKDEHEIAAIRRATEISVEGMKEGMRRTRVGMTSMELAGIMEAVWKREGSPRTAFAPIVTAGMDAVMLYGLRRENYNTLDHTFADGELVFVDYGAAEVDHYASDVARTFPANGSFTPEQRKYYKIVVEAQRAAIAEARPGARMIDLVRAAARVYEKHGLEQFEDIGKMGPDNVWGVFPSPSFYLQSDEEILAAQRETGLRARALGHHVGIVVTEPADIMMPFEPGMVFTVEPKIYSPSLPAGIMVEDMILITEDGHENLSSGVPVDPDEIERLMEGR